MKINNDGFMVLEWNKTNTEPKKKLKKEKKVKFKKGYWKDKLYK